MRVVGYQQSATSALNTFEQAQLVAADFDGTTHKTFESGPGIYSVDEVYQSAVEQTFDFDSDALRRYTDQGGHNNRTPAEIVHSLAPRATPEGVERLTGELVASKLAILMRQIGRPLADGTPWPRPVPGFVDCWNAITAARQNGDTINTAFVSAGHASFIRLVLKASGLEQPDILITEETIRGLNSPLPPSRLSKPVPLPLMVAKTLWLNMHGAWMAGDLSGERVNERIVMIGDSAEKDGGLARNLGVDFIHVAEDDTGQAWERMAQRLKLGTFAAKQGT
jgi:phosphoglycolate phosphatase-like HAD superfamily hydrolase